MQQPDTEQQLWIWAIFRHPKDYPGKYVVRRFLITPGGPHPALAPELVCDTLEEARAGMPPGLFNLGRKEADDPVIVETWI